MLTELIVGRTIAECRELTVEDLIEALDGMPPDKLHCPALGDRGIGGRAEARVLRTDRADKRVRIFNHEKH